MENEIKKLENEVEALKFRKNLLEDENHTLKIRLHARETLIEELRSELAHLRRKVVSIPMEGKAV